MASLVSSIDRSIDRDNRVWYDACTAELLRLDGACDMTFWTNHILGLLSGTSSQIRPTSKHSTMASLHLLSLQRYRLSDVVRFVVRGSTLGFGVRAVSSSASLVKSSKEGGGTKVLFLLPGDDETAAGTAASIGSLPLALCLVFTLLFYL